MRKCYLLLMKTLWCIVRREKQHTCHTVKWVHQDGDQAKWTFDIHPFWEVRSVATFSNSCNSSRVSLPGEFQPIDWMKYNSSQESNLWSIDWLTCNTTLFSQGFSWHETSSQTQPLGGDREGFTCVGNLDVSPGWVWRRDVALPAGWPLTPSTSLLPPSPPPSSSAADVPCWGPN